ncbi:hypothetical protein HNR46_000601 [Haloferula luteola]|uniref:Lipoprotein n=1 Tax=Haloferula luteola TaxID=595692 RepID=A0A840UW27_9BACT|nr:hypothetical protein [Haloferula luteola]MBB5350377.1 hypothetical protein [Haloferula luteola]
MRLLLWLFLWVFAACSHTAISPLSDPQGNLVVLEVPKARPGKEPDSKVLEKVFSDLAKPFETRAWPLQHFQEFDLSSDHAEVLVAGPMGDLETLSGRSFVGILPLVALRSNQSAESTENALRSVAAEIHRQALRSGLRSVRVDDLKEEKKPKA